MKNLKLSKVAGIFSTGAFVILCCMPSGMCHGKCLSVRAFKFERDTHDRGYIVSFMHGSETIAKVEFYEYSHTDLSEYGNEALFEGDPYLNDIACAILDVDDMRKGLYKFGCLFYDEEYGTEYDENCAKIFNWLYKTENIQEDLSTSQVNSFAKTMYI